MAEQAIATEWKSSAVSSVSSVFERTYIKGWHFCGVVLLALSEQCQLSMEGEGHLASILPKLSLKRS